MTPPTLTRGDVVLTRFPFTNLTGASLRPAVVVSQSQTGQDGVRLCRTKGDHNRHVYTKASHKPKYSIASREAP